jgi:hypothetical protein
MVWAGNASSGNSDHTQPVAFALVAQAGSAAAVASEGVKKRFHDLSSVPPDANELTPEVLQQLVTRDVEKYRKLLEEKK